MVTAVATAQRAEVHRDHRRQLRRRQLRHVRPRLFARASCGCGRTRASRVMGGEQAASVLATVRRDGIEAQGGAWPAEEEAAFKAPIRAQYEAQGHPYYATARLWDDGIIDPRRHARRARRSASPPRCNAPIERDALRRVPDVSADVPHDPDRQSRRDRLPRHPHRAAPRHPHRRGLLRGRCATRCTSRMADEAVPDRRRRRRATAICAPTASSTPPAPAGARGDPSRLRLPVRERRLRRGLRRGRHRLHRPAAGRDPRHGQQGGGQGADGAGRRAGGARLSRRGPGRRACSPPRPRASASPC